MWLHSAAGHHGLCGLKCVDKKYFGGPTNQDFAGTALHFAGATGGLGRYHSSLGKEAASGDGGLKISPLQHRKELHQSCYKQSGGLSEWLLLEMPNTS